MQKTADIITVFFETQADTEAFARRVAQALLAHESAIAQHGFNLRLNGEPMHEVFSNLAAAEMYSCAFCVFVFVDWVEVS